MRTARDLGILDDVATSVPGVTPAAEDRCYAEAAIFFERSALLQSLKISRARRPNERITHLPFSLPLRPGREKKFEHEIKRNKERKQANVRF